MRFWIACLLGFCCLLASAQPLVLKDDRGNSHALKAPPQRIVSLLPSLTEALAALGGAPKLVGVDRWSNWPAPALASLPRLGGLDDVQIETIARLKPDVVLASVASRSLDRLEALGFTVIRLRSESHADVRRTLGLVAQLLGQPEAGERLWGEVQQRIQAAQARVPARLRGQSVYFEIGGGPYAAGRTSFIGETLTLLGLQNVVTPELGPFPKLNPEFVVRARPGVVMGVAKEASGYGARPGWSAVPALQAQRVCAFPSEVYEMLIRPGPRLGEGAEVVAACLEKLR